MLFSEKFHVLTPFFADVPTGGRGWAGRAGELVGAGKAEGDASRGGAEGEASGNAEGEASGDAEATGSGPRRIIVHQSPPAAARIKHRPRAIHQR
ncbi:hypothetical protein Rhe02_94570 [Rhizocola hellebori]|uniref:Uncharacterized protein n=1 Tax=Rhizocola hellebori TaxID=1392758 RepID=A0A8J3QKI0_9ACTN|nr:hypothetical protein Rhe02_94570 [Rhizocola hellebori]